MFDLDIPVSLSFSGSKTSVHRKARRYCEWRGWWTTPVTSLCRGLCPTKHVTLQGGRMSPSPGTRFHLPSRDSCRGEPLLHQTPSRLRVSVGFQRALRNQGRQAGRPTLTAEGTSACGARVPHTVHTSVWNPCWGALSSPRPGAPSGPGMDTLAYTQPCQPSSVTGQEESEWLGDTDLAPRGASSRYNGGSAAPRWTGSTWPHKVSAS